MKPIVLSAPAPRSLDLIFTPAARRDLHARYTVVETEADRLETLPNEVLAGARYVLGQPPISEALLARMGALRAILNVESNLIDNMPYETVFRRGIHVLTTGAVFAVPVAELGLAFALNLARGVIDADSGFRDGTELWGGEGNGGATLLSGARVGLIGFGDLGRALHRLLAGFRCEIRVSDPWLAPSILADMGTIPASLDEVLETSDFLFVLASVTSESTHLLDAKAIARMKRGAALILLSRAEVVEFDALLDAVAEGHIRAATDVWPEEPLPPDHRARGMTGLIRSAHRAGAMEVAFKGMGDMVLEDMALMDRDLPPQRCKRAERETARRMQSRPVTRN